MQRAPHHTNARRLDWRIAAAWLISTAAATSAFAADETITVTTLNDVVDVVSAQVGNLPGPDGKVSFREAVDAANNTPGGQTIEFAIPQSEWWLDMSMAILRLEDGVFQLNDDFTVVDFSTQTDFTGDTNPNGWEVGIYGLQPNAWGVAAIFVNGDHCTIKGLGRVLQRGTGVTLLGNHNRVIGCTISGPLYAAVEIKTYLGSGLNATHNVIGGTLPEERNVLSAGNCGVRIDGASYDNVVIGNTIFGSPYAGVEVRGAPCCPDYTPMHNRIGGPTPEEANWIAHNGSYGEEGFPLGVHVSVEFAIGTIVEGNIIGTNQAGTAPYPNGRATGGVSVRTSDDTIVRDNVIAGVRMLGANHYQGQVFGVGVAVAGGSDRTTIQGNKFGVGVDGVTPIPNRSNMSLGSFPGEGSPTDTLIGGETPGVGNTIAHGETFGVAVVASALRSSILGNSIFGHGALGIDVGASGVTSAGAPMLASADGDASSIDISGTLAGNPNQTYRIEFFASAACDSSGFGEGQAFLGAVNVATNVAGAASFSASLSAAVDDGASITATATSATTLNTSEFSACVVTSIDPAVFGDIDGDGLVNFSDLNLLLSSYNNVGEDMPADLDDDGDVDFADLNLLLGVYNAGA